MTALPDKSIQNVLAKMRPELRQGRYDEAVEQVTSLPSPHLPCFCCTCMPTLSLRALSLHALCAWHVNSMG